MQIKKKKKMCCLYSIIYNKMGIPIWECPLVEVAGYVMTFQAIHKRGYSAYNNFLPVACRTSLFLLVLLFHLFPHLCVLFCFVLRAVCLFVYLKGCVATRRREISYLLVLSKMAATARVRLKPGARNSV